MSEIQKRSVALTSMSLPELAAAANAEHRETEKAVRMTLEHAIKAGEYLLQAQEQIEPGGWRAWVEAYLDLDIKTTGIYQRLAYYKDQLGGASNVAMAQATLKGLPARRMGPISKYPPWMEEEIAEMRQRGLGATEIAKLLGIPKSQIYNYANNPKNRIRIRGERLAAKEREMLALLESAQEVDDGIGAAYINLHDAGTALDVEIQAEKYQSDAAQLRQARQAINTAESKLATVVRRHATTKGPILCGICDKPLSDHSFSRWCKDKG